MFPTLEYAASCYLESWIYYDRPIVEALQHPRDLRAPRETEAAREAIVQAAKDYKVVRGFKVLPTEPRLQALLNALQERKKPTGSDDAINEVTRLVESLRISYGKNLVSAASKFLWFRFQEHVVLFDSLAKAALAAQGTNRNLENYCEYVREWRGQYKQIRSQVITACEALPQIKQFTLACRMDDESLRSLVGNEWFRERVFDIHLCLRGDPQAVKRMGPLE